MELTETLLSTPLCLRCCLPVKNAATKNLSDCRVLLVDDAKTNLDILVEGAGVDKRRAPGAD